MTSREKFEAWYLENWGHTEDDHETLFERDPDSDEDYYRLGVRLAHEAWQAAELASEQKLTDMAVQLANAESKCREMAAEVQAVRWACGQVYVKGYNHGHLNTVDRLPYADEKDLVMRGGEVLCEFTDPDHCGVAADAILAEVRAHGVTEYASKRGFSFQHGSIHAHFGNGDVMVGSVTFENGDAGINFAPVREKTGGVGTHYDWTKGKTAEQVDSVFVIASSNTEGLEVIRDKLSEAIAQLRKGAAL